VKTDGLVFKNHSIDRDVDKGMRALADHFQAPRGAVFRMCVESGIAQLDAGVALPPPSGDPISALRAAHIHYDAEERLRVLAFKMRLDHADLRQRVIRLGLLTLQAATGFVALPPSEQS
jgi:hypothetical protein